MQYLYEKAIIFGNVEV